MRALVFCTIALLASCGGASSSDTRTLNTAGQSSTTPRVTDAYCGSATVNSAVTCTLSGFSLTDDLTAKLGDWACTLNSGGTAWQRSFSCTPTASGTYTFTYSRSGGGALQGVSAFASVSVTVS